VRLHFPYKPFKTVSRKGSNSCCITTQGRPSR